MEGTVSYALIRDESGLLLERTLIRPWGQIIHSVLLSDRAAFDRWCEADDVRFSHPLLFSELRRRCSVELESAGVSQP